MAESNSSSYAQAGPGSGSGEVGLSDIPLGSVHPPPVQVDSNEDWESAGVVYPTFVTSWRNREEVIQASRGKSCEEIREQLRKELKAEFEEMKKETLDSLKKRDLLLEELTTDKKAMMTALELTQREVESMKTKLDDKNELLKIKDELLKSREEKIKELEKQLIEKESIIGRLQAEIKKSQEMIKQQNERIEALNSDVSDIQNRSTTREANLDQVMSVIRENEQKREEMVDKKVSMAVKKELESRLKDVFLSVNVSSPQTVPQVGPGAPVPLYSV